MTTIDAIIIEAADAAAATALYGTALGLGDRVRLRAPSEPSEGFRGFTLSLVVTQPGSVDALMATALEAGATEVQGAEKSLWGYGGSVQAPDGTIITLASSQKKDTGPASREIEDLVLQLGVADVAASKRFYLDHGIAVAKSFGGRYAELDTAPVTVTLNKRAALAKAAGVDPDGSGSHALAVVGGGTALTDPDGFVWEPTAG